MEFVKDPLHLVQSLSFRNIKSKINISIIRKSIFYLLQWNIGTKKMIIKCFENVTALYNISFGTNI